jgi:hypothetical protein
LKISEEKKREEISRKEKMMKLIIFLGDKKTG